MLDKTIEQEISKVAELTGVEKGRIKLADDGFRSRGYVIDHGRIVFKFKKDPNTSYLSEIKMLDFINSLDLGVKLQKVGWTSPDDEYLGVYGVIGKTLEQTNYDPITAGSQLGHFLQKLHKVNLESAETLSLDAEIHAWQDRFYDAFSWVEMGEYFSKDEMNRLDQYMHYEMPKRLRSLGEKIVLSHGDLGDGNIFINDKGEVGVIDFNETCRLDEAADFMDMENSELCEATLNAYNADANLRQKIKIRRELRPLIVFGNYAERDDRRKVKQLVRAIRQNILSDSIDLVV